MWVRTIPSIRRSSRSRPSLNSEAQVDVILHPDHEEPILQRPGTCLIVRAMMPGMLAIEVEPSRTNGSIAATVNIEPLLQGEAIASAARGSHQPVAPRAGGLTGDIRVLGHVAGIGDVYGSANEWLAGPTAPSRIEGISIEWPTKPEGVDIRYSVKTAQPLNISGRNRRSWRFCRNARQGYAAYQRNA